MLQETLLAQEELLQEQQEQQQQGAAGAGAARAAPSLQTVKASLAAAGPGGKRRQPAAASAAAAAQQQQRQAGGQVFGEEDEEVEGAIPMYQVSFGSSGTEVIKFDTPGADEDSADGGLWGVEAGDDGLAGWDQFGSAAGGEDGDDGDDDFGGDAKAREADEVRMLKDLTNDDDWGLDSFANGGRGGKRLSLLAEMAREQRELEEGGGAEGAGAAGSGVITWGGSAGATGIDLEEQEELLARYFRPHEVKKYMAVQREIDDNYASMRARAAGVGASERKLHSQLRIISGSAAGRRLLSARGAQTRPMMEKVRSAIFDMVQAQAGSVGGLPEGSRWLDLFAGTGSVGLEALSRGAGEAHFVELDPWVHRRVLSRNIAACGFSRASTCHAARAEDFLRRAAAAPRFAGGAFDFISVCPPYLLVSYPELYDLLEASGLIHPGTVAFVEYPKQLAEHVRPTLGPLTKVRDRKYGRTWIAVYAPAGGDVSGDDGSSGISGDDGRAGGGGSGASEVGAEWGL